MLKMLKRCSGHKNERERERENNEYKTSHYERDL